MAKTDVTASRVRELFDYNAETGVFVWLVTSSQRAVAGKAAGYTNRIGYKYIGIDGKIYLAHRLAWLYVHGAWPDDVIDHINGDPSDNRLSNLRSIPQVMNMQNRRKARKQSVSGLIGVAWNKATSRWTAQISVNGKKLHLGTFDVPDQAHEAYITAKREHHAGCTI